ncbi:MAG: FAD-dependent oxidoreductase [Candidatus Methylacidiphilales bacterium]|nr:FAD-dependent oxidoreductase [Candidatus Methylacidiphilales bacterium]
MKKFLTRLSHEFDVCVIGGGMSGVCAAIASARNGAKTALVHDRPVFGGNASSEVRMWICGAHGKNNKEAGILEEIQLENEYRNAEGNFSVWDSVLWGKIFHQPNLTAFLNCSCTDAEMDGDTIVGIDAWQLTSQTWHTIKAKYFIDCSGDSILAAVTGAEFRTGREARAEFNEDIQPHTADAKTMGNTLLIQLRRTKEAVGYTPPRWAYKFTSKDDLPHRIHGVSAHNFWWLEVGGLQDTIAAAEPIRDELMRIGYGVWDYIKNYAKEKNQAENWALEWVGSLPGKRENRRFVGDHVLTQNDVRAGGDFTDKIAYGGWSMDDHHPAGIYYPGHPTIFHPAPSPYGIPYRSLYSRNISNLLFAGRNISVTHAALSSTRVMGTCSIIGQAAGTAAALCVRHSTSPRNLSSGERLSELQATLMDDDCWLPGISRPISELARTGRLSGDGENLEALLDGLDRDRADEKHAWEGKCGDEISYTWGETQSVGGVRLVLDSNLNMEKRMPCAYPHAGAPLSATLVKRFKIEAAADADGSGGWTTVYEETNNYQRLLQVALPDVKAKALRFVPMETWGGTGKAEARVFAFEPVSTGSFTAKIPEVPNGPTFSDVRGRFSADDLADPESVVEGKQKQSRHSA